MLALLGAAAGIAVTACSPAATAPTPPAPAPAPPPPPPAACLLDTGGLATGTGLSWRPDQVTASDTRCVYDPQPPVAATASRTPDATATGRPGTSSAADAGAFLTVEITPVTAPDPVTELDAVAAACADGSRAELPRAGSGFVCRFRGGSVLAALVRTDQLVTVSASGVPAGTTAARLVLALQQQLTSLDR